MIEIVDAAPDHLGARERLLDQCFGPDRFLKPSENLRSGCSPVFNYSAMDGEGKLVGTVRLWAIEDALGHPALLLGPLAVDGACRGAKIGDRLMRHALNQAAIHGHGAVLLVGDIAYYARFGFDAARAPNVVFPGLETLDRLLAVELKKGGLRRLSGELRPAHLPSNAAGALREIGMPSQFASSR